MSDTIDFWKGDFGNSYTNRNKFRWQDRQLFWSDLLLKTGVRSIGEVGANVGYNLSAIKHCLYGGEVQIHGCEINELAYERAYHCGFRVDLEDGLEWLKHFKGGILEMVFTSGVLIHIPPEDLKAMMTSIVEASSHYVLAIEYEAEEETEVEYRGHKGKLWKRPYGKLYQDLGLKLVETGEAGQGFDRCTFWLLKKP